MNALLLLAALMSQDEPPLVRPPLAPELLKERTTLLKEMRAARTLDVLYVDAQKKPKTRSFRTDGEKPNAGSELLNAVEADFLLRPNAGQARCGFHTDIALGAKGARALKLELCFGCGLVRIESPAPATRWPYQPAYVYWTMVRPRELKATVGAVFPEARIKSKFEK